VIDLDAPIRDSLPELFQEDFYGYRVWVMCDTDKILTVRELLRLSRGEILRFPNLGIKSLRHIEDTLATHGLALGRTPPPPPETVCCETCLFVRGPVQGTFNMLACHRYAPRPHPGTEPDTQWPRVRPHEDCGEYQPRKGQR